MIMGKSNVRDIGYRIFTVIEFAAVFLMAASFLIWGMIF